MSLPLLIRNIVDRNEDTLQPSRHFLFPKKSRVCLKETLFLTTIFSESYAHHFLSSPPLHFLIPSLPPFPTNTCILTVTRTRGRVVVYRIKKMEGCVVISLFIDVISTSANTWIWRELFHLETWDSRYLIVLVGSLWIIFPFPPSKPAFALASHKWGIFKSYKFPLLAFIIIDIWTFAVIIVDTMDVAFLVKWCHVFSCHFCPLVFRTFISQMCLWISSFLEEWLLSGILKWVIDIAMCNFVESKSQMSSSWFI